MAFSDVFKKMFPFLATAAGAVGGPIGAMAASVLGKVIGADVKPETLVNKIQEMSMTEEGRLKLEQAEHDFALSMQKLGFEHEEQLEQLLMADRANAREREKVVRDKMPTILGLSVTGGFFGLVGLMAFHAFPEQTKDVLLMLVGALTVGWKDVMGYFFGSSAGSDRKTEILASEKQ